MNEIGQINSDMSAALAVDLASDIWPEAVVLQNHGLDPMAGATLLQSPWFKKMLDQARSDWGAISNAKQRIRLKAQVAIEEGIADVYAILSDKATPAAARVSAFKELKDLSGAGGPVNDGGSAATGPSVNIYLNGGDPISINAGAPARKDPDVIDITPDEVTPSYHEPELAGFTLGMQGD
tara:strand:+ start:13406 stop:13945 length:540 start_codon:yes stop_codon:yes gene_type:complete